MKTLRTVLLFSLVALAPVSAQSGGDKPDPPSQSSASRVAPPDPLAVNPLTGLTSASSSNYQPLTGKQRKKLYWKQNYFSVGAYVGPVLSALILDQATGSPHQWGGGMEGFGHRLGSRLLSSTIQGNVQAALAVPLHEDVRYISSGHGSAGHRIIHAVVFSFVTYNNHGHATLNIANITGYYASTAVSTAWIPTDDSVGKYTLIHGSEQIGLAIPVNIIQEFWPDISRKFFHH
jgi:hypothetical protein